MRKLIVLTGGWGLLGAGAVLMFAPVPIPLLGTAPLLAGAAILSANSKSFRRRIQGLRHRFAFLSAWLERFLYRAPKMVKVMIRRTRPLALRRLADRAARRLTRKGISAPHAPPLED
jgi:hypothetical protein